MTKKESHLFIDEENGERLYYDIDNFTGRKKRLTRKQSEDKYGAW